MSKTDQLPVDNTEKSQFPISGMNCGGCASTVKSALESIDGVSEASINLANHSATVLFNRRQVDPALLQAAVRAVGYDLVL
ncbi:MAG: heavy metal-associated domain-containing protein [Candidatus Neomarinimicrobiota bacterium]